jgi:hypothetical protein
VRVIGSSICSIIPWCCASVKWHCIVEQFAWKFLNPDVPIISGKSHGLLDHHREGLIHPGSLLIAPVHEWQAEGNWRDVVFCLTVVMLEGCQMLLLWLLMWQLRSN